MLPVSRPVPVLFLCRFSMWGAALACSMAIVHADPAVAGVLPPPDAASNLFPRSLGDPILIGAGLGPALPSIAPSTVATADAGPVSFEADQAEYDDRTELLTATGSVFLRRQDQSVRADKVTWNRKTGKILATGNVRLVDKDGNQLFSDRAELTDQFDVGAMQNMLLALREGGRLAANSGQRDAQGRIVLAHAGYTGCAVVNSKGCDVKPSWRIDARRVLYDPTRKLMRFYGARLTLFGIKLPAVPATVTITTDGRALGGLLIPNFRTTSANGLEFDQPYYLRLSENKDITATAFVYTKVMPMAEVQYRALNSAGVYQITAYATSSTRIPVNGTAANAQTAFRGYLDTNGQFQLSPEWDINFSGRIVTDRTFLNRYGISGDDELRSTVKVEHIDPVSYFAITGWAFQTLRTNQSQGLVPVALPEIDYRRRIADPLLGGVIELQGNSLAITRTAGQDTQRAFVSARWDLHRITPMGQVVTLTALVRGDAYHSSNNYLTTETVYQGLPGWQTRGSATAAVDVTWPFVGAAFGGTQVVTPHVQFVGTPPTPNLSIPNEDSRAVELEDDNLFALNRFPGYDRIEDGARVTYGLDYQLERPGLRTTANIGESYRLTNNNTLLPAGTGLSGRWSDYVGRFEVRYRDFLTFTERFRIDHDSFTVHRNEVDATVGSERTYFELGYLRLNRQTAISLEDLQDSNELRAAGRVAIGPYLSVFGSGVFDLSQSNLLSNQSTAAFQPLRTRLGVSYKSDCLELDFTYRRDYITIGDATQGSSFMLHLSLKHLGLR